jgi:hypothetical protein
MVEQSHKAVSDDGLFLCHSHNIMLNRMSQNAAKSLIIVK